MHNLTSKGISMNEQNASQHNGNNTQPVSTPSRRRDRRWALAGAAAALIGAMSIVGISHADDAPHEGHRAYDLSNDMHRNGPKDPATADKHIDRMIERMLPDGTPEQKTKVRAIAKAAMNDLRPLHEQHRAAREQVAKVLSQPTIDRAALEKARARESQLAEQMSKRKTQALADAAEVLTPEQRAKAAERFKKHREHRGMEHKG